MASLEETSTTRPSRLPPAPASPPRALSVSASPARLPKRPLDEPMTPQHAKKIKSSPKVNVLTMEQKKNVIKLHNKGVIGNIIRQKDTILPKWTEGIDPKAKYVNPRHMVYTHLDKKCFEWFCSARDLGYVATGPLILDKANIFALEMGLDDFSRSTGWLDAFKKQHWIKFTNLCGESADVPTSVIENYHQTIQTSAKATTHMTFSILMRVACSTISYKPNHWCDMMTTDMGAKDRSTKSTSP